MPRKPSSISQISSPNAYLFKYLCQFIVSKFLIEIKDRNGKTISQNEYAKQCGISSSTLTKLKSEQGYDIPISTIYKFCRYENIELADLFNEFEAKYGTNLPD